MKIKKPMLASKVTSIKSIRYPVYASPKIDGIRALTSGKELLSRKLKPIPNKHVQRLAKGLPSGLDGELVLFNGKPAGAPFNETSSAVMSVEGEPNIKYHVFDYVKDSILTPARDRHQELAQWVCANTLLFARLVTQKIIWDEGELLKYEQECLANGFEGVMLKAINGVYKEGRSTEKEGLLLKLKRFSDSEAIVTGFEEKMHNDNVAEQDALGYTKRSSKKEGLIPAGTLGKLYVKDIHSNIEFDIGSGFDDMLRKEIWKNQKGYWGKIVKYKYQECGTKDRPRFPVFIGFRSDIDI